MQTIAINAESTLTRNVARQIILRCGTSAETARQASEHVGTLATVARRHGKHNIARDLTTLCHVLREQRRALAQWALAHRMPDHDSMAFCVDSYARHVTRVEELLARLSA